MRRVFLGASLFLDPQQDKVFDPLSLNFYAYSNLNPLIYIDPDGRAGQYVQVAVGTAVVIGGGLVISPGLVIVGGFVIATGVGIALGVGARAVIHEMAQRDKKQAAGFARQAAIHLADYLGRTVGGHSPRPGKEPGGKKLKDQVEDFIRDASRKADRNWNKFSDWLKSELRFTQEAIDDFVRAAYDAGIDLQRYFPGAPPP